MNLFFKKINTTISIHSLLWIFFLAYTAIQSYSRFSTIPKEFYFLNLIFITVFYFNYIVLVPKFLLNKKIITYVVISLALIFFIIIILAPLLKASLQQVLPIENLRENFPRHRKGSINLRPPILLLLFFASFLM